MELEGSVPLLQVPVLVPFLSQNNCVFSTVGIISSSQRTSSCFTARVLCQCLQLIVTEPYFQQVKFTKYLMQFTSDPFQHLLNPKSSR